jgi:hypothetical protein
MTAVAAQVAAWASTVANLLGTVVLAPLGLVPGWLSATIVSGLTGVLLLIAFKYTSNQRAIKRVRDDISANLLALKLFHDSTSVAFQCQVRLLVGAWRQLVLAIVPVLVMTAPVTLLLSQLALWYQARALHVGEETVVTVTLSGAAGSSWPRVSLRPTEAVEVIVGPVRIQSQRSLCWSIQPRRAGYHRLVFQVADQIVEKELAVGDGLMRVSRERPGWDWMSIVLNPGEPPFRPGEPLRSIEIAYPRRLSWTSGTDSWVIYWFAGSMTAAVCFRRVLHVSV